MEILTVFLHFCENLKKKKTVNLSESKRQKIIIPFYKIFKHWKEAAGSDDERGDVEEEEKISHEESRNVA